jgi:hypothetical protein
VRRAVPGLILLTLLLGALSILSVSPAQAACTERVVNVPSWHSGPVRAQAAVLLRDCGAYTVAEKVIGTVDTDRACKGWTGDEEGVSMSFDLPYGSTLTEPYQKGYLIVPCKSNGVSYREAAVPAHRTYRAHQNWTVTEFRHVVRRPDKRTSFVGHFWPVS